MWISPTRLELAAYRICVYISLMTSGELVRFYSLSVAQNCQEGTTGILCAAYFDNIFG